MSKLLAERIWGVPWSLLVLAALAVAIVYLIVDTAGTTSGWQWFVLRWFHSLCWLLLAGAALLMSRITPLPVGWAGPVGMAGAVAYAAFIITTFAGKA